MGLRDGVVGSMFQYTCCCVVAVSTNDWFLVVLFCGSGRM